MREVAKPLSFGKPSEKICEDLKKKDGQICELRYGEYRCNIHVQEPSSKTVMIMTITGHILMWC